ncbi:NUDIX domain-containing protein [Blastococcus sp. Marseille-P5729]|uniref:NUDIX domain-containing protein n=1 Tax=Blastococcus sp. Marseille-P5729 TaxID=2086582 RepID=UPI000D0EDA0D|nr:NUDIX domain-containing protein [Blastococcus sp. Marseille-P5729]
MDWSDLAHTSGDVRIDRLAGEPPTFELSDRGRYLGVCGVEVRDASVARLSWELTAGSVGTTAHAVRVLIEALYTRQAISRVEVVVDNADPREVQIAMRTGLRREGVLRGGLRREDVMVDGALFAGVAGDPAPTSPGGYTYMLDSVMPLKRLISHVVMTDPAGRILLCQTTFKKDWELPGGIVEPGESPVLAARREVAEEIGIELSLGRLLALDWLPPYLGWSDAIEVLYDGGEHDVDLVSRLVCDTREIKQAAWFAVDEIASVVSPLNARRLPLLIPQKPERTLHLEAGQLAE